LVNRAPEVETFFDETTAVAVGDEVYAVTRPSVGDVAWKVLHYNARKKDFEAVTMSREDRTDFVEFECCAWGDNLVVRTVIWDGTGRTAVVIAKLIPISGKDRGRNILLPDMTDSGGVLAECDGALLSITRDQSTEELASPDAGSSWTAWNEEEEKMMFKLPSWQFELYAVTVPHHRVQ
jgi:hypothetical protein